MTTALVTGATAGIGRAFALELAARRHDLVLVARDTERLDALAADLRSRFGVEAEVLAADLADRAQVERVAERLRAADRPVEILVNNAGFGLKKAFVRAPIEDEERMVAVLVSAVLVLTHAAVTAMVPRGRGTIVNVSSVASFVQLGTYSAAKAWVTVFTEGLANDLRGTGVRATALCPGFTRTEFHSRADMDMSHLPEQAWLDADRLVRDCLDDVERGRAVSIPGRVYKVLMAGANVAPRPLLRRVSARISGAHRPGRL